MSGGKNVHYNLVAAFGARRVSVDMSKFSLDPERELVMWSPMEAKVDQGLKGVFKTGVDFSGATDSTLERRLLLAMEDDTGALYPVTIGLVPGCPVGSFAYLSQALLSSFKWSGDFKQVKMFDAKVMPQDRAWFGGILGNSVGTAGITVPVKLPGVQLGSVAATVTGMSPVAGQFLLLSLHVLDPPGVLGTSSTMQVLLESNPNNTDWSTAVTRATLPLAVIGTPTTGQFKAPGAVWVVIDGDVAATTDTWWRLNISAVGGTTPNFYILAAGAVGSKLNV